MQSRCVRELLASASALAGEVVEILGWVRTRRVSKNVGFLAISDGSCVVDLQLVVERGSAAFELLETIHTGASVRAWGQMVRSSGQSQAYEMHVSQLLLVGGADPDRYPLQKKAHSLEFLREIAHLRPRTRMFGAVLRLRDGVSRAIQHFLAHQGFIWVHTPILSASDGEGAGEMFAVVADSSDPERYFGRVAQLTVTGQLQAEAVALSHRRVYTFGPTFRAENSNTSRHLCEFWMVEPEAVDLDLPSLLDLGEALMRAVAEACLKGYRDDLEFLGTNYGGDPAGQLERFLAGTVARVTYRDALDILGASGVSFDFSPRWGDDLASEHERYLCEKHFGAPVWVVDYPRELKAFYMYRNDDGQTVAAADFLFPGIGEVFGGSVREHRLPQLEEAMHEKQIPSADLEWYLDLRRFGTVPHAGFGLGLERLMVWVTGMTNVRDVILSPRAPRTLGF